MRAYFIPLTPFGFTLQGFPLSRSSADSSPARCRLAVFHRLASRVLGAGPLAHRLHSQEWGAAFCRLHGFALLESPFRARPRLVHAPAEPLLGFLPLQGLPALAMPRLIAAAPPVCLSPACAPRVSSRSVRRLHCGVSFARVVASSLSRPPSPPEVLGHLLLSIRRRLVRAYRFALGPRWRRRSV